MCVRKLKAGARVREEKKSDGDAEADGDDG